VTERIPNNTDWWISTVPLAVNTSVQHVLRAEFSVKDARSGLMVPKQTRGNGYPFPNSIGIRRHFMARITAKQEKAIMELLRNPTVKEASQQAGVGERTLWRWLQEDDFREAYMEARKQAFSRALGLLLKAGIVPGSVQQKQYLILV
jgi:hypothetical protein